MARQTASWSANTTGSFAVNGVGTTAGSGGTIQNITNRGASFINATNITLKNMNFTNVGTVNGADPTNSFSSCGGLENTQGGNLGCNAGIHLVSVTGATFDRLVMNGGVQQGINGNNVTTFALSNSSVTNFGNETGENGIQFRDLLGTNTMTSNTVTGNRNSQLNVTGTSGTLTLLTVTGGSYGTSSPPNGTDGITVKGTGSANMTVSVQSAAMSNNASDGFFYSATDTSFVNATVNASTIQTNGNSGINVNIVNNASGKFTITATPSTAFRAMPSTSIWRRLRPARFRAQSPAISSAQLRQALEQRAATAFVYSVMVRGAHRCGDQ